MTHFKHALLGAALLGAFSTQATAGGFQLTEQSVVGLGRAYAGIAAEKDDLSGVYYNPAAMQFGQGTRVQSGMTLALIDLKFEGVNGSKENGRPGKPAAIPHAFVAHQVNDRFQVGFGVTAPFGLETSYGLNWDQSLKGVSSDLRVVDFNPAFSFKLTDTLTIGGGVSAQHVQAKLGYNAADMAKAGLKAVIEKMPGQATQINQALKPILDELNKHPEADVKVSDWGYGWNVGLLFQPADTVRVGWSYRSAIKHTAKGDLSVPVVNNIKALLGGNSQLAGQISGLLGQLNGQTQIQLSDINATSPASISMSAPAWSMLSASWDINPTFTVSGTVRWTQWSVFKELRLDTAHLSKAQPTRWKDNWLMGVGLDTHVNPDLTVRTGFAYETGVISDPTLRSGTIPDTDRLWLSLGASYRINKRMVLDTGASLVLGVGERNLYHPGHGGAKGKETKLGRFKTLNGLLLGAQLQYQF